MIIDGISLTDGSTLQNLTIDSGAAFPSSPNTGELFYKTTAPVGLHYYSGSAWEQITVASAADTTYVNVAGDSMVGALTLGTAPTADMHAATKAYVDLAMSGVATGLDFKESVRLATTANITLSGPVTIDAYTTNDGDRVLVKNQSDATQNGVYVAHVGAWTRASDFDGNPNGEVSTGAYCYVETGNTNGGTGWVLSTSGTIILGSTNLTFMKVLTTAAPTIPYDVGTFFSGKPTASEKVIALKTATAFTLAASLEGSLVAATTAATASTVFTLKKNGTQVNTITFAAAGTTATFGAFGAVTFAIGDVLTVEAPATPDATLADIMITLKGIVA